MSGQEARRKAQVATEKSLTDGVHPEHLRNEAAVLARRGETDRAEGIREALKERR